MIVYQCRPKDTQSTQLLLRKQSFPAMLPIHLIRHLNHGSQPKGLPSKIATSHMLSTLLITANWSTISSETSSQMTLMAPTNSLRRTTRSWLRLSHMSMLWASSAPATRSSQHLPTNVPSRIQLQFGCAPLRSPSVPKNQKERATGRFS